MRRKQLFTYAAYTALCFVVLYGFWNYNKPILSSSSSLEEGAGLDKRSKRDTAVGASVDPHLFGMPDQQHMHGKTIGASKDGIVGWVRASYHLHIRKRVCFL